MFCKTATVANGRVKLGDAVRTSSGDVITIEAIWVERDRRIGNTTFVQGKNGTRLQDARGCYKV